MKFHLAIPNSSEFLNFEASLDDFNSKKVTYRKPEVWRLWIQVGDYRVNLHKIFKSEIQELFHPHPWIMRTDIIKGTCEVGFGFGIKEPALSNKSIFTAGSSYEMLHPELWHYVKPTSDYVLTIMVSGKPWLSDVDYSIKPEQPQGELSQEEKEELWSEFKNYKFY